MYDDATSAGCHDPADQIFVRPNATIIVHGRRRVLARDDSFIRRPSNMNIFNGDNGVATSSSSDPKEEFNQASADFATSTEEQRSKGFYTDAVLKARAAERARQCMSKDDSLLNRTSANKLEPLHFLFAERAFHRVGGPKTDASARPESSIATWQRPTLAESWDMANTLNLQTMASTRNVGANIRDNQQTGGAPQARNISSNAAA